MSTKKVLFSSLKMAVATFCSRIMGLIREQLMAHYFGASGLTDAFLVAYRIPNLLRDLLAEGAFSSAFVPTFVEAKNESDQAARSLLWELFFLLGGFTAFLSLMIFIFAPELITIFAPSFVEDQMKFEITVNLTRIMSPFLFFISLAALFMGALNSLKVFFVPSLAPAFYNLMSILSMIFLTMKLSEMGYHPVYALGWGALLGGIVQALVQFPILISKGFSPTVFFTFGSIRAKKVIKLLGPGLIGFAATQINLLINTILATGAGIGATSWLNYSFRLFQLPVGILSVSIGNSNLVHFSSSWKKGDKDEAITQLQSSIFLSFLTVMPAMAFLLGLSEELVHYVFERGKFDRESTQNTALALQMYALGLPLYSLYKIWVPTFYALDKQRIPVIASLISITMNIIFCVTFTPMGGFSMLSLGTSVSMLLNCTIQIYFLKIYLNVGWNYFFNVRLLKLLTSASLVLGLMIGIKTKVYHFDQGLFERTLQLSLLGILGLGLYAFILLLTGEHQFLSRFLPKRFRKK